MYAIASEYPLQTANRTVTNTDRNTNRCEGQAINPAGAVSYESRILSFMQE